MINYPVILIIVSFGIGHIQFHGDRIWPVITTQRFESVEACRNAATEIRRLAPKQDIRLSCVPAATK